MGMRNIASQRTRVRGGKTAADSVETVVGISVGCRYCEYRRQRCPTGATERELCCPRFVRELRSESSVARTMVRGLRGESSVARAKVRGLRSESSVARAFVRELRNESSVARACGRVAKAPLVLVQ